MPHLFNEDDFKRFDKKIFIDTPDQETREEIINTKITSASSQTYQLSELDKIEIAKKCQYFVGSNISNMLNDVSMKAIQRNMARLMSDNTAPLLITMDYFNEFFSENDYSLSEHQRNGYKAWNKKLNGSFDFEYKSKLKRLLINGFVRFIAKQNKKNTVDLTFIQDLCVLYFNDKFMIDVFQISMKSISK